MDRQLSTRIFHPFLLGLESLRQPPFCHPILETVHPSDWSFSLVWFIHFRLPLSPKKKKASVLPHHAIALPSSLFSPLKAVHTFCSIRAPYSDIVLSEVFLASSVVFSVLYEMMLFISAAASRSLLLRGSMWTCFCWVRTDGYGVVRSGRVLCVRVLERIWWTVGEVACLSDLVEAALGLAPAVVLEELLGGRIIPQEPLLSTWNILLELFWHRLCRSPSFGDPADSFFR